MSQSNYTLLGATGAVGKSLAAELFKKNTPFLAVGRSEQHLRDTFQKYEPLVQYRVADFSDPQSAAKALEGVHTAFYLVGAPYHRFDLHPKLMKNALDAAGGAGVRRFVHVSTVYPYGMPEQPLVDETHPRNPHTFKGQMRKEQEDLVFAADGRNGMRTTMVRPPDFYGPEAELSYVRSIFDAALSGGRANVIGSVDTPHEFIYVPDLARTLLALAEKEEAYGQAWNVAGPGLISTRRFAELAFQAAGAKVKLLSANLFMLRLFGLFSPMLREIAEMYYLSTNPVHLDDSRLRRLLPDLRKTSYEDGIRETVQAMQADRKAADRR